MFLFSSTVHLLFEACYNTEQFEKKKTFPSYGSVILYVGNTYTLHIWIAVCTCVYNMYDKMELQISMSCTQEKLKPHVFLYCAISASKELYVLTEMTVCVLY